MTYIGQYDDPVTCALWLEDPAELEDDPFSTSTLREPDNVTKEVHHDPGGTDANNREQVQAPLAANVRALLHRVHSRFYPAPTANVWAAKHVYV